MSEQSQEDHPQVYPLGQHTLLFPEEDLIWIECVGVLSPSHAETVVSDFYRIQHRCGQAAIIFELAAANHFSPQAKLYFVKNLRLGMTDSLIAFEGNWLVRFDISLLFDEIDARGIKLDPYVRRTYVARSKETAMEWLHERRQWIRRTKVETIKPPSSRIIAY